MLGSQQGGPTVNWCTGPVVSTKNPWHSLTWFCQKCWRSSYDQSTTTLIHCQVSSISLEIDSIGRELRQGCSLSASLFIIYDEAMVREVRHECTIDNRIGGKIVNMIRYADDKAVVAGSQKGLQELMNRLNTVTKECVWRSMWRKQRSCVYVKGNSRVHVLIDDQQVEQVSQFKYLGRNDIR